MSKPFDLYCDGGVIGSNPSGIGGTYAWLMVGEDGQTRGKANVLTVEKNGGPVTNNQTEMLALLRGLEHCPDDWVGCVYSDSAVTLGRIFLGWKWNNIPQFMHLLFQEQRRRLESWGRITHVQLDGHPTKAQLVSGVGKRGNPVSEHNVWCDHACTDAGAAYLNEQLQQFNIFTAVQL
jgi:ribonuclease HI